MTSDPWPRAKRKLLFGTTIGMSADVLLRGQLRWFSARGWEVSLATSPGPLANAAASREGVSLYSIHMERAISLRKDLSALIKWIRLIREVRPDAVNLGTPKASLLGGIAAWTLGVKQRIYVVRGLRLEGSEGLLRSILWLMERLTIALATDVVVVSPSLGRELVHRKLVPARKAWLIHKGSSNGVDSDAIIARTAQIDAKKLRKDLGIQPEAVVVGYIGRITRDKGVATIVRAFQQHNLEETLELLLIGSVEDPELFEEVQDLGARVHILPWANDIGKYLPAIDILCLPTYREGFPNVVLEGAAAAIPSITTRATGAVDSVVDGKTGYLIEIEDETALAERLNQLARDPWLRDTLGSAAQERAREHYRPETIWRGLASILDNDYENSVLTRLDRLVYKRSEDMGV